jgi:hypothetical protein
LFLFAYDPIYFDNAIHFTAAAFSSKLSTYHKLEAMPKKRPSQTFDIHVDRSCMISNPSSLPTMPAGKRTDSDLTVLHHTPSRSRSTSPIDNESEDPEKENLDHATTGTGETDEDAKWEEKYNEIHEQLLSQATSMNLREPSELSHLSSLVSTDSHTEALIQAAARVVVASMEEERNSRHDDYDHDHDEHDDEGENSILSERTDGSYAESQEDGTEYIYGEGTELTYGDETEQSYERERDEDVHEHEGNDEQYDGSGSASSLHEDDDDVFSSGNTHSHRSSLNSITDPHTDQETHQKQIEPAYHDHNENRAPQEPISRLPSGASQTYCLHGMELAVTSSPHQHTPSKVLARPPFRTPSSVRALQMTSPTPSIFSSPRSAKRPSVSCLGSPQTHTKKTPTRFKFKKEHPLILLHVTVLPVHWNYSEAIESLSSIPNHEASRELVAVAESLRLLKAKTGDIVLERGVLLAHPQDEYEILEERLLEALELPVRPRAKILTCGHYLGPEDDSSSDNDYPEDSEDEGPGQEKWCDICDREVYCENFGLAAKQKRFRVKVYASNGLMTAGSWQAAWREMEKVDVEIEPLIPNHLVSEMEALMQAHTGNMAAERQEKLLREEETRRRVEEEELERRRKMDEERMREIYGHPPPLPPPTAPIPHEEVIHHDEPDDQHYQPICRSRKMQNDSLLDLLLAAMKVALQDRKNILIVLLSIFVMFLALRPTQSPIPPPDALVSGVQSAGVVMQHAIPDIIDARVEKVAQMLAEAVHVIDAATAPKAMPVISQASVPDVEKRLENIVDRAADKVPEVEPSDREEHITDLPVDETEKVQPSIINKETHIDDIITPLIVVAEPIVVAKVVDERSDEL